MESGKLSKKVRREEIEMQNAKCKMQNAECKMQNAECRIDRPLCPAGTSPNLGEEIKPQQFVPLS